MPRRAVNPRNHNLEPLINAAAQRKYRREQLEAEARIEIDRKMAEVDDRYYSELRAAELAMVATAELQRKTGQSYPTIKLHLEEARLRHEHLMVDSNVTTKDGATGAKLRSGNGIFRILNGWTLPVEAGAITHEHGPDVEISISGAHLPPGAKDGMEVSGTARVQVRSTAGTSNFSEIS